MIASRLLIHTCIYREIVGHDRDGNKIYSETELTGVRLMPVLAINKDSVGETKNDRLTLYYDCVYSEPVGVMLQESAQIVWNGASFTIRSVQPCYTHSTTVVHHYEAALV